MSNVKGLDKLLKKLDNLDKNLAQDIDDEFNASAESVARRAKKRVPVDTGKLRQSIRAFEVGPLHYRIAANATGLAPYAPYIEFGTGGLVNVPTELKDIAIKFKGKGVKQINLRPRPYLYPSFKEERANLIKNLEKMLERETGKI